MSRFLSAALCTLVLLAVCASASVKTHRSNDIVERFRQFKERYGKQYATQEEESFRMSVYQEALKFIESENSRQSSYELAENNFADLTHEEFKALYLKSPTIRQSQEHLGTTADYLQGYTVPTSGLDWRTLGAVTPVKDQGQCGSCYTFATTGVVEGYYAIYKGFLPSLSEQQIVDCARLNKKYSSNGCDGGDPYRALQYVADNGLNDEATYPYTGKVGQCKLQTGPYKIGQPFRSFGCSQLVSNLLQQPTGVSIDASAASFQYFKKGVFNGCSQSGDTNHAVLAVGWDAQGNWIIKNSWNTSWGDGGFVRFQSGNTCHVCEYLVNAF